MPRPAANTSWATTGGRRIEPSAPEKASGFVEGTRTPAKKANWLTGMLSDWQVWLTEERDRMAAYIGGDAGAGEWVYPAVRGRQIPVDIMAGREMRDASGLTPEWAPPVTPLTSSVWTSLVNSGEIVFPLNALLRDGMVITDIKVTCKPGAARAGANRMRVGLLYFLPDHATPANNPVTPQQVGGAFVFDDTTANKQNISLSSILGAGHTVDRESATFPRDYFLHITAGNTGAASPDVIYGIALSVNDPGPRNY